MPDQLPAGSANARRELSRELLCVAVLATAFVVFASLSWRTWPDSLVDFGQELYVPWRLANGDVLYRDIAWVTGPLSQYANSLLFRLFGVSLTTLICANLVLLVGVVTLLYGLFRQCGNRWSATFASVFFLTVFAFGQYSLIGNYNYVCPYRHDNTHGLVLGLVNLWCLSRFGHRYRPRWLVASGLCLGLLCLTKIEMLLAACVTSSVALPLFAWQKGRSADSESTMPQATRFLSTQIRDVVCWAGLVIASASVPVLVAIAALTASLGWVDACGHIFLQYRLVFAPQVSTASGFYRAIAGTDQPSENLIAMAFSTGVVLGALAAMYFVEFNFGSLKTLYKSRIALGVGSALCGLVFVPFNGWNLIPTSFPLLLTAIILHSLRQVLRRPSSSETLFLLLAAYSISLLPKILLRVNLGHYGFVLAMPATLVFIHVLLYKIPVLLRGRSYDGQYFQAVATGLLGAWAVSLAISWIRIDFSKTVAIGQAGDRFYAEPRYDSRTLPVRNTLRYLRSNIQDGESLIVFPNGVMLNYLLRTRNPTPYIMFNPFESDVHGGEDLIADTVIRAAPDYAVLVTMDLAIHGRGNFGSPEFGGRILQFLNEHYDIVDQQFAHGGIERGFVSIIFKRRSSPETGLKSHLE